MGERLREGDYSKMEDAIKTDMKNYYNNRKIIQSLYLNDTLFNSDLAGTLLGIRDQMPYIDTMALEIQSLRIRIEIVSETNVNDILKIFDKVGSTISNFIAANIDKVTDAQTAEQIRMDIFAGIQYFDINHVGNMIEINL